MYVDPEPSSWRTVNLNLELIPFVRYFALYVTFCSVWCYLAILCSFTKISFCSNMLTTGMRWMPFPSFSSLCIFSLNCQRDCSCFLTLPGKLFSEHSKNVLHCCYSFASHFSSHVTIMLRVDVWLRICCFVDVVQIFHLYNELVSHINPFHYNPNKL